MALEILSQGHLSDLWHHYSVDESTWKWLPGGEPSSQEQFNKEDNMVFATVGDPCQLGPGPRKQSEGSGPRWEALGMIIYGDISIEHRTLEGGVIFAPTIRRTFAAIEAHYLFLRNVFDPRDGPPYRRVSWKTNSRNLPSCRAAQRLGYVYEGTWRNHMIDRGQNRDSSWWSMIDDDWPVIRTAFEQWLGAENFDENGRQIGRGQRVFEVDSPCTG